jgi:hypothetical protein
MIKDFLKKSFFIVRMYFDGLFFGMRHVNSILTTNQKDDEDAIHVNEDGGGVFHDIMEQKLTQEVEELRYASYKIANESRKYKYIGNGRVRKKTSSQLTERHGLLEESDDLPILLIQDNFLICEDVLTVLNEVNNENKTKYKDDFHLKIERDIYPRFFLETYVKKLVLKESEGNYVIDLYCSKYPRQFSERKDRLFIKEIANVMNGKIKGSDVLDFTKISFITQNAWGVDDWFKFVFYDFELHDIIDFDGNYVIRLGCQSEVFMENIINKLYSSSMEEKYQVTAPKKNNTINMLTLHKEEKYTKS